MLRKVKNMEKVKEIIVEKDAGMLVMYPDPLFIADESSRNSDGQVTAGWYNQIPVRRNDSNEDFSKEVLLTEDELKKLNMNFCVPYKAYKVGEESIYVEVQGLPDFFC